MSDFYRNLEDSAERIYLDTKGILSSCQAKTNEEHKKEHLKELAIEAFKAIEELRVCFKENTLDPGRKHDFLVSRLEHLSAFKSMHSLEKEN